MQSSNGGNCAVKRAAIIAGCIWAIPVPKMLIDHPISATMCGVAYGSLCAAGASIVAENLPEKGKYIFAGIIGISAMYHLGKTIYNAYNGISPTTASPLLQITVTSSSFVSDVQ